MDKHNENVVIAASSRGTPAALKPPSRRFVRWLMIAAGIALVVVAAYRFFSPQQPAYTVSRTDLIQTIVVSGRVQTPLRVDIGSQITGTVASIPVAEGQTVRRGQLLIAVDDTEAKAAVAQAQAAVRQAEARLHQLRELALPAAGQSLRQAEVTLRNAQRQYERSRQLHDKGFIGQAQLDDAQRSVDLAESQWRSAQLQVRSNGAGGSDYQLAVTALEQAKANLRIAMARLDYCTIEAPSDGTLIARNVERGDVVQPGKALMVLSPSGKTQLVVQMDERNLGSLRIGQQALASADAYPEQHFPAELSYINPAVDPQRGSVEVKFDVPATPEYLRQDMTVSVDIEVARRANAVVVPSDAVKGDAVNAWVLKVDHGKARRQPVRLGLRGAGKVEVLAGLNPGEQVLAGASGVKEGQRVHAVAAPAAGASR